MSACPSPEPPQQAAPPFFRKWPRRRERERAGQSLADALGRGQLRYEHLSAGAGLHQQFAAVIGQSLQPGAALAHDGQLR